MKKCFPHFARKLVTMPTLALLLLIEGCTNQKAVKETQTGITITTYNPIVNKYWKLIALNGQTVTMAVNQQREIYFTLKTEDNRVTGFSGCNTFNGTYKLHQPGKIEFSQMRSTMMACPDVGVNESEVLEVFSSANTYKVVGDSLWLGAGTVKQMATFAAIYFH